MPYVKNYYINILFVILVTYTAYTFLWLNFGLGVTSVVQYLFLGFVSIGFINYIITPSCFKNPWTNLLIIVWITQILAFYFGNSSATTQFKESTFVLLTTLPILSMTFNPKHIKWMFIVMAIISILMYFVSTSMMKIVNENSYGGGYQILVALPVFLYFFRSMRIGMQMTIVFLLFVLVLLSMKRGDILAYILSIAVFFYIKLKSSGKIDFRILLAFVLIVVAGYFVFTYLLATNDVFAWRFEQTLEGDSSDRDNIYSTLWNYFLNAPLYIQLFGGGFDATLDIVDARAHSDLLEILSCEGVIGLIFYLSAFFSLYRQMCIRVDITEKATLAVILVIWLVKMFFSMFIFSQPSIILFALASYILNNRIDKQYEY